MYSEIKMRGGYIYVEQKTISYVYKMNLGNYSIKHILKVMIMDE